MLRTRGTHVAQLARWSSENVGSYSHVFDPARQNVILQFLFAPSHAGPSLLISPSFMWSLPESRLSLLLLGLWLAGIWPLRTQAQSVPAPRTSFVTRSPCLPGASPQRTGAVRLPPEVGLLQEPAVPSLTESCPQSPRISASPPQNRKNPSSPGAPVSRYGVIVIAAVGAVYATHLLRAIAVTSPPPT